MPDSAKPVSFRLPTGQTVEGYLVELPGGRQVIRTREELTRDPQAPRPTAPPTTPS